MRDFFGAAMSVACLLRGLNPNSGVVLPQKLISGFPDPAATCIIRESLVRVSLARLINSTDS